MFEQKAVLYTSLSTSINSELDKLQTQLKNLTEDYNALTQEKSALQTQIDFMDQDKDELEATIRVGLDSSIAKYENTTHNNNRETFPKIVAQLFRYNYAMAKYQSHFGSKILENTVIYTQKDFEHMRKFYRDSHTFDNVFRTKIDTF